MTKLTAQQKLARDYMAIRRGLGLNQFNWIVGPVLGAYARRNAPLAIVVQGHNAFAVVNEASKDYLGCCPNLNKAIELVEARVAKDFSWLVLTSGGEESNTPPQIGNGLTETDMATKTPKFKALYAPAPDAVVDLKWRLTETVKETVADDLDEAQCELLVDQLLLAMLAWTTENVDLQLGEEEALLEAANVEWFRKSLYGTVKVLRFKNTEE